MSLLNAKDISDMRITLGESLPDSAVILTESFTSDSGGGGTMAVTASGTVDCRLAPMMGDERLIAERVSERAMWMLTAPVGSPITEGNQISVGGTAFQVLHVHQPRSWPISLRAELEKTS